MTDGCVYLICNRSWKFRQLGAKQLLVRATGAVRKIQAVQPVHHEQIHTMPGHSPPFAVASASCAELPGITDSKTSYTFYGPEAYLTNAPSDRCRFLNCSVRMGGRGFPI